ncbi:selenide, water dikinase SelD [Thiobacillus sedimenti]|uniref:Selenide, water dikinase n=1 Tax=Thiobacillus sedimenti TaxID=3110231 RepID=A0ABZ1CF47_9PROT|nr:selenide, water dikinase SelD [Thiobacillus sp. SCUT-2]WRS37996.1 selenide, water dikinase SelD [Thiobacillus sp. SCUT-2]
MNDLHPPAEPIRLTAFSHGGGCGCKIAPAVLQDILADTPFYSHLGAAYPDLLVGIEHGDDAAVYKLNDGQAIVATTDFFMPIVDDPFDFGRIAATNALSDVYAMGGKPLFALAIVGMPIGKLPNDVIRQILAGGESVCRAAGIPIAGGHSIDAPEPIYGLVGIGVVDPRKVKQNAGGQAGDCLILGKPLGVGIYSAALKKGLLSAEQYAAMIAATTQLNTAGADLADTAGVHAMTDITGFGLLGHLLEITRASKVSARVEMSLMPVLPGAAALAQAGHVTGASQRNWASYGGEVQFADGVADWQRALLTDPQTSGGLLVSCAPDAKSAVLDVFRRHGFADAAEIGRLQPGRHVAVAA